MFDYYEYYKVPKNFQPNCWGCVLRNKTWKDVAERYKQAYYLGRVNGASDHQLERYYDNWKIAERKAEEP